MKPLDMIPGVSTLKLIGVGVAGSVIAASLTFTYVSFFTIPAAKQEAAQVATAKMLEKFNEVSDELASDAEKFRSRRIACRAAGGVFSFATGDCRKD